MPLSVGLARVYFSYSLYASSEYVESLFSERPMSQSIDTPKKRAILIRHSESGMRSPLRYRDMVALEIPVEMDASAADMPRFSSKLRRRIEKISMWFMIFTFLSFCIL